MRGHQVVVVVANGVGAAAQPPFFMTNKTALILSGVADRAARLLRYKLDGKDVVKSIYVYPTYSLRSVFEFPIADGILNLDPIIDDFAANIPDAPKLEFYDLTFYGLSLVEKGEYDGVVVYAIGCFSEDPEIIRCTLAAQCRKRDV